LKFSSFIIVGILIALGAPVVAQAPTGSLRGQVTDPSGAVVTNATVAIVVNGVPAHSAATDRGGIYEIGNLAPGRYTVTANAKGFAPFAQTDVEVTAGQTAQLNIALEISVQKEKVNVEEQTPQVDVNPASNASALVLSGKDLEALPDDPDELQQDLEALAGPSAGPNGGQIYIDGFTAGQLPPKESIREIRINQNPFSAEYDKLGYGRIEIFTKPGTDKFHGQISVVGNSSGMNSRNPFLNASSVQPYDSEIFMGNVGGPINKKASFFFDVQRRNINEVAVVNAQVLDSNFQPIPFNASVPNPRTRTNLGPRLDYQVSPNNTLTARYQYFHDTQDNAGVGQFALPSTGFDTTSTEHTVQISDTQILGTKAVNETRFQYRRENSQQTPLSTAPTISVDGEFTGGGSSAGAQNDHTDHYELQNYTSLSLGKHFLKFGGRLRAAHDVSLSGAGFNGTFRFHDLASFMAAEQLLASGQTQAPGAIQFSISATPSGVVPTVDATVVDAGLYVQDDLRLRPNITLSYGLRFETQSAIHDHGDFAPRIGFAWGIGGGGKNTAKTVLRAGYGLFYDRFGEDLVLNANRMNGVTQQQFLVSAPDFYPLLPDLSSLTPQTQTIYRISPNLHAPYIMQSAVSLERQVTKIANVTVSYLNARGVHQFVSLNVNAPIPGTPGSTGLPPFPNQGPIYQYSSDGVFRQNQLITNFNIRAGAKLSLFGFYSLNYAKSDTSGASSFPTDQYDLGADYGRASFDTRHRLFLGGTIGLPYAFRLSPFLILTSGSPYNVTVGQDLNHDSLVNDRPAFANNPDCPSLTAVCHYNPTPAASEVPVPINFLTGPDHFTLNLRLAKTFGFGPEKGGKAGDGGPGPGGPPGGIGGGGRGPGGGGRHGGGGGFVRGGGGGPFGLGAGTNRRYNLTLSLNARNLLNRVNAATPVGSLGSGFFGQSIALAGGPFSSAAANRKIELQAMFSF
jgi:Carboxypeptidase regulatory-like domain